MLVLSRKKNESLVIDDDVTIIVVEIRGDKVRLGVEAPKEVPVHRKEVYDAIKREEYKTQELKREEDKKTDQSKTHYSTHYSDFRHYLETGEYSDAYDVFTKDPDVRGDINDDELVRLVEGLGDLNKILKTRLDSYEGIK